MKVNIGKGIELDIDVSKLNTTVTDHVMYIGLRNILMDSHANVTRESDGANYVDNSRATAEKKLAAMYAGEVRAHAERQTDPIGKEMRYLARQAAIALHKKTCKENGTKFRDVTSEDITETTNNLLQRFGAELRERAERRVADMKATGSVDFGI